jgi:hypothetical protein
MNKPKKLLFVLFIFISTSTFAQNIWLNDSTDVFGIEFVKPSFKSGNDRINFLAGAYNLSLVKSVSEKSQIRMELPVTHFSGDFGDSETSTGNFYLGYRNKNLSNGLNTEIGIIMPLVDEDKFDASSMGFFGDFNRIEMFSPNVVGLTVKVKKSDLINEKGLYYKVGGDLLFLRETDFDENFFYLDFTGQIGYKSPDKINILAGISGRMGLNENTELDIDGDKSILFFGAGISYRNKNIEPGISLRIPIDKPVNDFINNSVAFSLLFHLK